MHLRLQKCEKLLQTYRKLEDLWLRNTSCSFAEFAVAELSLNLRCPALDSSLQLFSVLMQLNILYKLHTSTSLNSAFPNMLINRI